MTETPFTVCLWDDLENRWVIRVTSAQSSGAALHSVELDFGLPKISRFIVLSGNQHDAIELMG